MTAADIPAAILALLAVRAPKTACPSEVARTLSDDWRPLMPAIREAAARMPDVVATQGGTPVDPLAARGPIRLSLRPRP